jgi:hypothetical protein
MKLFLYVEKHQHGEDTNVLVVLKWNSDQTLLTRILSNEFLACYTMYICMYVCSRYDRNESLCFIELETSKTHILNNFLFHKFYTSTRVVFQHLFAFSYSPGIITDLEVFTVCSSVIIAILRFMINWCC